MVLEFESLGDEFVQASGASMNVEEPVAGFAVEVVVVLSSNAFELVSVALSKG